MDGGDVSEWSVEEFLELVYGSEPGWIDLPARVNDHWQPFPHYWTGTADGAVSARIDSCLRDSEDLYFSVGKFKEKKRREENFLPSSWLWADLDEVHPSDATQAGLAPTIAWESSEGRFQCLWELDRELGPEAHAKLSRALSYHIGADPGGWDCTQVLRPPGSRNFKYKPAPFVRTLWYYENQGQDPRKMWAKVRRSHTEYARRSKAGTLAAGRRGPLPVRARQLLRVSPDQVVEGERSHRLWELNCVLAEAGWGADSIFDEVSKSAWHKWSRMARGDERLRRDISRAIAHVESQRDAGLAPASSPTSSPAAERAAEEEEEEIEMPTGIGPFARYEVFMAKRLEPPRWLIEDIWTDGAVGIIGGEPKTMKSTLALALAMSVAGDRPFLNRYPVHKAGPVLMVQEENSEANMQSRMQKIGLSNGLIPKEEAHWVPDDTAVEGKALRIAFPHEIPLFLLNNWGFDLSAESDRQMLYNAVMDTKPALVILDPLLMMAGDADLDRSFQVKPMLQWLMELGFRWNCSIAVVHHMRKQRQVEVSRAGQRMLGTTMFHGWAASALYCERVEEAEDLVKIKIEREFREQGPRPSIEVKLGMGDEFTSRVREWSATRELLDLVASDEGITANQAAKQLGWDRHIVLETARDANLDVKEKQYNNGVGYKLYLNGSE